MRKTRKAAAPVRIAARDLPTIPIAELIPYENNAKLHGPEQIRKLRASLRKFGFVSPVLIDEQRNVIAGHGRIEAAKAEGMTEVPYVTVGELTEAQRRAYILADNRRAEDGAWDMGKLRFEMEALNDLAFDVSVTGFEMDEVEGFSAEDAAAQEGGARWQGKDSRPIWWRRMGEST